MAPATNSTAPDGAITCWLTSSRPPIENTGVLLVPSVSDPFGMFTLLLACNRPPLPMTSSSVIVIDPRTFSSEPLGTTTSPTTFRLPLLITSRELLCTVTVVLTCRFIDSVSIRVPVSC